VCLLNWYRKITKPNIAINNKGAHFW